MKELEKTKRISISAVLFLLVIVIAVLAYKRPQYNFRIDTVSTLNKIAMKDYILSLDDFEKLDPSQFAIIDTRSSHEYKNGHIERAVNISSHDIFTRESMKLLNQLNNEGEAIILYGRTPDNANSAWMLLYQMGYNNVKVLCIETDYVDNVFQISSSPLEKASVNFAEVMASAKSDKASEVAVEKPKKKVITVPKKKKRAPEGGC